ncbi:MAG: hypothetical protein K6B41_11700 [Butyrivibrio sp.]|nr:hypothetical protein [Butyrivibrio sp.]
MDNSDNRDDYYYNNYNYNRTHNPYNPRVSLANSALILGLLSIAFCMTGYISLIMAGVGITIALLTREKDGKLFPQAKRGIRFSIVGIVFSLAMIISAIMSLMDEDSPTRAAANEYSQSIYGITFDEMLESIGDPAK